MADQLKQIVSFVAVPAGNSATLAHNINSDGIAYIPDEAELDNGDFQITAISSTSITVHNYGVGATNCDVLLQLWQSNTRALGANTNVGNFAGGLTPRPFIGASSGGGALPIDVCLLDVFQTFTKAHPTALVTLTDAATIATDASLGLSFLVVLGGNRTLGAPTNLVSGGTYTWIIAQDGGGTRTLAYDAVFDFQNGTVPVIRTGASVVTVIQATYDGTKLRAVSYGQAANLNVPQTWTKSQNVAAVALVDAATVATDAALANVFTLAIGGNRTLGAPTNLVAGGTYMWIVSQTGGGNTLAYNAIFKWPGGVAPILSAGAGAVDVITGVYNGTIIAAVAQLNFS